MLIVFDTARADAFEPWGAPAGVTPTVTGMSSDGVVVPNALATACWTVPSHGSILGGQLPRASGLATGSDGKPGEFVGLLQAQRDRLLPSVLGAAGYDTAGVSTNLWVSEESGFDTGFDRFRTVRGERYTGIGATSVPGRARWYFDALRARVDDGAVAVEQLLQDWLGERDTRDPFFWFVNLVECHSPYLPPKPWNDLGVVGRLRSGRDVRRHQTFAAFCRASLGGFDVAESELERMRHLYSRSVALLDAWLARVLTALDEAGVLEETLVLVTSDHGENLGEGGLMGHCFSLDDRLLRVPFVAQGPGADSFASEDPWSLAEVPRTIARAIDLDDHPWQDQSSDGIAVAELDAPCGHDDPIADSVITDLGLPPSARELLVASYAVATDGRWKLRRHDRTGTEELVDLSADELELAPVSVDPTVAVACDDDRPGALGRLRAALDRAAAADRRSDAIATPGAEGEPSPGVDVDDLAARMELLGYL